MLETARLILRQWTDADASAFFEMNRDPKVMEHFPSTLSKTESDAMAHKIRCLIAQRGWGFWAIEIPDHQRFIGFVGLHKPEVELPFLPCVEIGWRIAPKFWNQGYATEAAERSLEFAFTQLALSEVVSFASLSNHPSQQVMRKLGMSNTGENFMHPNIENDHPLCEHVLYKISQQSWQKPETK